MRKSKYWDDFERRIVETVDAISLGELPKVRRVACFITDKCNFKCKYCNNQTTKKTMTKSIFIKMLEKYGDTAIIHITGGEPSVVPWLYPFLSENKDSFRFHLNTNAYKEPPSDAVKRLKVSLDSKDRNYWNALVGKNAFNAVVKNIKKAIPKTIVSITYTLTKQNYNNVVNFTEFCNKEFIGLYAIFFSVYKGNDKRFILSNKDADNFFSNIIPKLLPLLNDESRQLLMETIDEKRRLMQGIRFKQNNYNETCYLSMSERVFAPDGKEYTCSHLYRDGIYMIHPAKNANKCSYGCNRRLVAFNEQVQSILKARSVI